MSKQLHAKLVNIQSELKAPKNQFNSFGKYKYRSAEDILEAVKPLLKSEGVSLRITEFTEEIGGFLVMSSTAILTDGESDISVTSQAGINPQRKGMDIAQSFGSSSSYSKKYALGNLFLLDDTKDVDSNKEQTPTEKKKPTFTEDNFKKAIAKRATIEMIEKVYDMPADLKESYEIALKLAQ
jgi:hypothetical protein